MVKNYKFSNFMKIISIILVLALGIMCFAACNNENADHNDNENPIGEDNDKPSKDKDDSEEKPQTCNGEYEFDYEINKILPALSEEVTQDKLDLANEAFDFFIENTEKTNIVGHKLSVKKMNGEFYLDILVPKSSFEVLKQANETKTDIDLKTYNTCKVIFNYMEGYGSLDKNCVKSLNTFRTKIKNNEVNLKLKTWVNYPGNQEEIVGFLNIKLDIKGKCNKEYTKDLEDGVYELEVQMLKSCATDTSMSNQFNSGKAYIEVKDGKKTFYKEMAIPQNFMSNKSKNAKFDDLSPNGTAHTAYYYIRKYDKSFETDEKYTNKYMDYEITYSNSNNQTEDGLYKCKFLKMPIGDINDDYLIDADVTGMMFCCGFGRQQMIMNLNENSISKVDNLPLKLVNQNFEGTPVEIETEYQCNIGKYYNEYITDGTINYTIYSGSSMDILFAYQNEINNLLDIQQIIQNKVENGIVTTNVLYRVYLKDDTKGFNLYRIDSTRYTPSKYGKTDSKIIDAYYDINLFKNYYKGDTINIKDIAAATYVKFDMSGEKSLAESEVSLTLYRINDGEMIEADISNKLEQGNYLLCIKNTDGSEYHKEIVKIKIIVE